MIAAPPNEICEHLVRGREWVSQQLLDSIRGVTALKVRQRSPISFDGMDGFEDTGEGLDGKTAERSCSIMLSYSTAAATTDCSAQWCRQSERFICPSSERWRQASLAGIGDLMDHFLRAQIESARRAAEENGDLSGRRTRRIRVRLDDGLIAAAQACTGITGETELIEAALALMVKRESSEAARGLVAEPDDFVEWLLANCGRLDSDFKLAS